MLATRGYDRRGASMMAISALDIALHDLAARSRGISVAELLGGSLHSQLLAYASGPFMKAGENPYRDQLSETDDLMRRGFRGFKPRVGYSPRTDGAAMVAMRKHIGPDSALMVDINQGYTSSAAIASAHAMAEADLLWIEEPVQPEDIRGYRTVADAISTAVAGGEALGSLSAFREFFENRALAIVQPDLAVCGGFSGMRKIAALADAFEIPTMPHVFGTVVNYYASLQMASIITARRGGGPMPYPFIEIDVTPNPMMTLLGDIKPNVNGTIDVPTTPGLGFDLSTERFMQYITTRWSEKLDI